MTSKHRQYFQHMLENHKDLFDNFKHLEARYQQDPKKYQDEYNEKGEEVLVIIRKYENMLCSHSEGGKYGKFSSKLSDKYREMVRKYFPKIDFVGLK